LVVVNLVRGRDRIPPEKGLKILKKKLMKEKTLREMRDRQYYVTPGRKAYLARSHRKHVLEQERLAAAAKQD